PVVPSELPRTRTGRLPSPSRVPSISRAGSCAGAAPSDIEEHRLPGALEADVEAEYAGAGARLRGGDQRGAPVRVDRAEHRVAVVRGLLVGEVDPGHDAFQQAAGEHRDVQVRGLPP